MKKKLISIMLLCVAIISLMIIPATADSHNIAERCYLDMGREGLKDVACARIQRCSCLPVDNYLAVMLQVQYRVEGSYFWEPSANTYKIALNKMRFRMQKLFTKKIVHIILI